MEYVKEMLPRAILIREGKVLLVKKKDEPHYFLIGGRMEKGENILQTLRREIKEELNKSVKILDYVGAIEHHFSNETLDQYEINHYFTVEIPDLPFSNDISAEEELEFLWTDNFENLDIRPAPVKDLLKDLLNNKKSLFWRSTIK